MALIKKTRPTYIGLDIKKNIVRFVEMKSINPPVVKKYGEKTLPSSIIKNGKIKNDSALRQAFKKIFSSYHLSNQGMVYAAFNQNVLIKSVELPAGMKADEIKKFLFLELGDGIQMPFDNPVFDLIEVTETSSSTKKKRGKSKAVETNQVVYFVATPAESLNLVATTLKKVKQYAAAVDITSLAYQRIIKEKRKKQSSDSFLLLEVDCGVATFTIFEKDIPIYTQYEEYNPGHWAPAPEDSEEVDWLLNRDVKSVDWNDIEADDDRIKWLFDEEVEKAALKRLCEVVSNVLYYYSSVISVNKELSKMMVTGDNPLLQTTVKKLFKQELDISFEILSGMAKDSSGKKIPARYNLALGLAMKEV